MADLIVNQPLEVRGVFARRPRPGATGEPFAFIKVCLMCFEVLTSALQLRVVHRRSWTPLDDEKAEGKDATGVSIAENLGTLLGIALSP